MAVEASMKGALGVFRVRGEAQDGVQRLPWRLILKIVDWLPGWGKRRPAPVTGSARRWPTNRVCLRSLPDGLRAPICYGVTELPAHSEGAEEAWIWLEEIPQDNKPPWTLDRLQQAARDTRPFQRRVSRPGSAQRLSVARARGGWRNG